MEPFKYHVYVCRQKKPEGVPSCLAAGAESVAAALTRELASAGLSDEVQVTGCDCLGLCGQGPNLVVYPDGVWYQKVKAEDAAEIVREHFGAGRPVERLVRRDGAAMKTEIVEHGKKVAAMKEMLAKGGMMPEPINAMMRGFMESRAMLSALELDVFSAVGDGSRAEAVASKIGAAPRSTEALLNALASMGVLNKRDGVFTNSEAAGRFFRSDSPDDSRQAAMHIVHLWHRWSTLTDAVKAGTTVVNQGAPQRDESQTRAFIAAMHKNASLGAGLVASVLDLAGVTRVLDVGGGSGAYSMAMARKKPDLQAVVFDLPAVTVLTDEYVAKAGLAGRVITKQGDMQKDDFGEGYDLALVFAICHMWSPEENLNLFRRVHKALKPGGRIVIQDFVLAGDKTSPRMGAVFALNMLVNTKGGSSYSKAEYLDWLGQAGFGGGKLIPLPGPTDLVTGTRQEQR